MNVPKLRFKEFNDEWVCYKFGDIINIINGLNKEKESFGFGTPIINYMDVNQHEIIQKETISGLVNANASELSRFKVEKGDILFTRTSETSEEIGLSASVIENIDSCVFSGFILKGKQIDNKISPYFGGYYFRNPKMRKEIVKHSSITTRALTSGTLLNQMVINLPSTKEQKMIGSLLMLIDKKIELQSKKIEDLKLFKKGLLTEEYNIIKYVNLCKLGDLADIYQPQTLAQNQLINGEYDVFGANGIIGKHIHYNHKNSQITVSCRGENSGAINVTPPCCWINGNSMVINIDNNTSIKKEYLNYILQAQNLKYLISGSGQPQIIRSVVQNHKIPILTLEEQTKFSEKFSILENKITLEITKLNKLQELKKGLMQSMFV